jgi:hypothetical protein
VTVTKLSLRQPGVPQHMAEGGADDEVPRGLRDGRALEPARGRTAAEPAAAVAGPDCIAGGLHLERKGHTPSEPRSTARVFRSSPPGRIGQPPRARATTADRMRSLSPLSQRTVTSSERPGSESISRAPAGESGSGGGGGVFGFGGTFGQQDLLRSRGFHRRGRPRRGRRPPREGGSATLRTVVGGIPAGRWP